MTKELDKLLQNAVSSIQIGIEDYQSQDHRRQLSTVRNITAGILLLYKHKLYELSPTNDKEAFLKANLIPKIMSDGSIGFVGGGHRTVDVFAIRERFKHLNIDTNWGVFKEISDLRNDIEHYYTDYSKDTIREIITKSFVLIRDFISLQLNKDPLDLLGKDCWNVFLEIAEIYSKEETDCNQSLEKILWKNKTFSKILDEIRCPDCHSELVKPKILTKKLCGAEIELCCRSCSEEFILDDIIEDVVQQAFYSEAYLAMTQGGEPPFDLCPECEKETFVFEAGCCLSCEYKAEFSECSVCHQGLSLEEQQFDGICSYHHNLLLKDD